VAFGAAKRASSELPPGPLQPNKKQRNNNFEREGSAVSSQLARNNARNASAQRYDEGYAAPKDFDDVPGFQGNEFDDYGMFFLLFLSSHIDAAFD